MRISFRLASILVVISFIALILFSSFTFSNTLSKVTSSILYLHFTSKESLHDGSHGILIFSSHGQESFHLLLMPYKTGDSLCSCPFGCDFNAYSSSHDVSTPQLLYIDGSFHILDLVMPILEHLHEI